jgi:DNA-binding XRE family transcriptional regulator
MKNPVSSAGVPKLALTRKEVATALGVSMVTIDRLTERGLLKPSRATRRPLFAVFEIERFLLATQGPPPNRKPCAGRSSSQ